MKNIILIIAIFFLYTNPVNAQCDCENFERFFYTGNQMQFGDWISKNCELTVIITYDRTVYQCNNIFFEIASNFQYHSTVTYCNGLLTNTTKTPSSNDKKIVLNAMANWGVGASFDPKGFQDFYKATNAVDLIPNDFSLSAGCYSLIRVKWPPKTECKGQVVGENSKGPIIGITYPPNEMFVQCESDGCCVAHFDTEYGSMNFDPNNVICGAIDESQILWTTPCGVFKGFIDSIEEPCKPVCGTKSNIKKMISENKNNQIQKKYYSNQKNISSDLSLIPNILVQENGNSINIQNYKNVKNISILDITGKIFYNIETSNFEKIDISKLQNGVYIIQLNSYDQKMYNYKFIK